MIPRLLSIVASVPGWVWPVLALFAFAAGIVAVALFIGGRAMRE